MCGVQDVPQGDDPCSSKGIRANDAMRISCRVLRHSRLIFLPDECCFLTNISHTDHYLRLPYTIALEILPAAFHTYFKYTNIELDWHMIEWISIEQSNFPSMHGRHPAPTLPQPSKALSE